MAWKAECKRRNWYRILEFDATFWYRLQLHYEWVRNLTDQEEFEFYKMMHIVEMRILRRPLCLRDEENFSLGVENIMRNQIQQRSYESLVKELFCGKKRRRIRNYDSMQRLRNSYERT